MPEIDFSVMVHTPQSIEVLRSLLDEFTRQSGIRVNLHALRWETAHAELNKTALYHHGADVSEIASTWVSDLIAMNALRPFSPQEINQIGRPEDFVPESWRTGHLIADHTQWAIPWLMETYVIHYRADLLKKAGIEEAAAFSSLKAFVRTAEALRKSGVTVPVEIPLHLDSFGTLHALASWVWSAGGDFCDQDGKEVLFNRTQAAAAIRAYFQPLRDLPASARQMMRERQSSLFERGLAGIYFGTMVFYNNRLGAPAEVQANWKVAPFPGPHFMGGSNLVVWKHTRSDRAALALVRFMTSTATQQRCALPLATMPPRLAALSAPEIAASPHLSVFAESARTGRSYFNVPLWGLIEDRLVTMLQYIGSRLLEDESMDMDVFIQQQLDGLARRLNITLEK